MSTDVIRILLIEPSEPWITNNATLKNLEQVMVPIGLMYLSSYIKHKLGEKVKIKIINTLVDLESPDDLEKILLTFSPHIVGVRWVIFYTSIVKQILKLTKKIAPRTLMVLGGPNINENHDFDPPETADILVQGEGEITFYEIVRLFILYGKDHLLRNRNSIKGIMYRDKDKIIKIDSRENLDNLDQLPVPDYSDINFEKYSKYLNFGYNRRPMAALFTSRGCPYFCIYCHRIFGKKFRKRNAGEIYEEIKFLNENFHINDFCIVDDNFNFDKNRVDELTRKLINNGPKINLYFPNGLRGDLVTPQLIDQLIMAGMIYVSFSLETASPRLQKLIKKNINIEKLKDMVFYSCEKNVITNLAMMVGFPTETMEEAKYSLEYFAQFKKIVLPYYFSVKYYPGTELYNQMHRYSIDVNKNIFESPYHGYKFQETPDISLKEFEELNLWYLKNIFMDPLRLQNTVDILSLHFSKVEINDMFSLFFRKPIEDIESDVIKKHCILQ